jgi:hypothetical protein
VPNLTDKSISVEDDCATKSQTIGGSSPEIDSESVTAGAAFQFRELPAVAIPALPIGGRFLSSSYLLKKRQ